ncbi:hypothetical protein BZG36_05588, partial [Bifiguratus adelaidae]
CNGDMTCLMRAIRRLHMDKKQSMGSVYHRLSTSPRSRRDIRLIVQLSTKAQFL